ncbi:MAG: Ppx/GppA family phosphatase [Kordiimonadaceae bacterium]|nr:Ppx/GppA family phosphatase [Kordiimonadaceae bacterium]
MSLEVPRDTPQPARQENQSEDKSPSPDEKGAAKRETGGRNRRRRVRASDKNNPQDATRERQIGRGAEQSRSNHDSGRRNNNIAKGVYSAIDLGTNNCRLLVAKPTGNGFRVIDAFSRIVRLGEGVSQSGNLSEEAMDRTIEALKVCAEKIKRRNVTCMRHVATEACRVAGNADEFIERVRKETGINLDIITAGEEARLAVMGCQSLIAPGNKNALVFDIGGGSTELIWVRVLKGKRTEMRGWMSIPWGVVNLSEEYGQTGQRLPDADYEKMVNTVKEHLHSFEATRKISEVVKRRKTQFLGTSGTVTTLASLHLKLPRYIRDRVDGAWMKTSAIKQLSRDVARMTHAERAAQPCIGEERADLVVAGCAILEAILGMWHVPSLRVADRGIREGILRGLMQTEPSPIRTDKPMAEDLDCGEMTAKGADGEAVKTDDVQAVKNRGSRKRRNRGRRRRNRSASQQAQTELAPKDTDSNG